MNNTVLWYEQLLNSDVDKVGGKNASLGEMISQLTQLGIQVPNGFATTAETYRTFLAENSLSEFIYAELDGLDTDDTEALARVGTSIRNKILSAELPASLTKDVTECYQQLGGGEDIDVAVRSSATAEDLPTASFAGQQETFLNVKGIDNVLLSIKEVFASLFNDRAIAYRVHQGFDHKQVALSAGIQRMVRSDKAASGVMFTLDTETGFEDVVLITASHGLGETVVQGAVNPDEFYVFKPSLKDNVQSIIKRNLGSKELKMIYAEPGSKDKVKTIETTEAEQQSFCISDDDVTQLAKQALLIEQHYGRPMDIEWAKDGISGELFIVQARPETVKSRDDKRRLERYEMNEHSMVLVTGRSIGQKIGQGKVRNIRHVEQMHLVEPGDVLVTDMTDPDWEPVMKRAAAIVTNRGGRTCHAAIIARELDIPAVVGCGDATEVLESGSEVTVSCAEGDTGTVYRGLLSFEKKVVDLDVMPELPFKIMMNVGNPERAFEASRLPHAGVGLARLEFIINRMIGIHPRALLDFDKLDNQLQATIRKKIAGYNSPTDYYIDRLAEGIATIAAAFAPEPVIVRLSDFKSNEYANLIGGAEYEPNEENPMIGFRGASRYVSESFKACFELECEALKKVRQQMGLTNVQIMVPFVRTVEEAQETVALLGEYGLKRGENELKLIMMCELPANAILADDFLQYFDGFSIGSNDLTQLTLGLDRDSALIAHHFDERNPAIKALLHQAIQACKKQGKYIGICGQGPSDYPDFAQWLVEEGIDSVSLNPDSVLETWLYLADTESR